MELIEGSETSTIGRRGNTQKNTYNIQNTAKVWNQELNTINMHGATTKMLAVMFMGQSVVWVVFPKRVCVLWKMNFDVCYEFWGSCVFLLLVLQQFREPNRRCTSDMRTDAAGGFIGRSKSRRSVLTCTLRATGNCLQIGASWLMFWAVNRVKCSWGTLLRRSNICHSLAGWEMTMRLDTAA